MIADNRVFVKFVHRINDAYRGKHYALIIQELTDCSQLDEELVKQQEECEVVGELVRRHIDENARSTQNQSDYQQRYDSLAERYAAAHQRLDALLEKKQNRVIRSKSIQRFMEDLQKQEALLTGFDEELWIRMVESVTVFAGKNCRFNLKDGSEVQLQMS